MKDLLITHTDLDGISPIILMNLTNRDFEYKSIDIADVEKTFEELLTTDLTVYENIYVTDLSISESIYEKLKDYKNIKVFDHHETHLYANAYSFVEVKVSKYNHLTCGTELFYKYLAKTHKELDTPLIRHYVDLVRQIDTWDFKELELAKKVGSLPFIYGKKEFIKLMTKRLKKDKEKFELTTFEKRYTKIQEDELDRYIKYKEKKMEKYEINNYKVGIVFAERHKDELGNYLSMNNPDLDMVAIISGCEKISYRTVKDDVKCNSFAQIYNGGGHQKASGSIINEEVRYQLIEQYFKDVKRLENEEN